MINVLPLLEKRGLQREYYLRLAVVYLCNLTFLALLASVLLLPSYMLSLSKEVSLEERLAVMNKENPDVSLVDLNTFIDKINSTLALFNTNLISRNISHDVIYPVLDARTSNIKINQILFAEHGEAGAELDLHGVAQDRESLQAFKLALEKTGKYQTVDVPISSFVKKTNINFTITILMK